MHPSNSIDWNLTLEVIAQSGYRGRMPSAPFWFGDSNTLCLQLTSLVCAGVKTATASLLWEWQAERETPPEPGTIYALLEWQNQFRAIIETSRVQVLPFGEVTAEFAALEGEGDLSLEYWRRVHWPFFHRVCEQIGRTPAQDMPIVCQQFVVSYIPDTH
jgi:uncharacterized protein YhfF